MISLGAKDFIELGAGSVLSGLVKRIDINVNSYSVETIDEIENFANNV